jgi:hypothetical protein
MTRCIHVLGTTAIILLVFSMDVRAADVPYLSGGVGADAREELLAREKEYNRSNSGPLGWAELYWMADG